MTVELKLPENVITNNDNYNNNYNHDWKPQNKIPLDIWKQPLLFKDNTILFIPNTDKNKYICLYDIDSGSLNTKYIKYPKKILSEFGTNCIDKNNETIYIHGGISYNFMSLKQNKNNNISILKVFIGSDEDKLNINKYNGIKTGFGSTNIVINNQLHIIGGVRNDSHYIYNKEINKFQFIFKFPYLSLQSHKIIYIESKKELLLFGGFVIQKGPLQDIWSCNLSSTDPTKWKWHLKKSIKLPLKLTSSAIIYLKYPINSVVFFGGYVDNQYFSNIIWFFDLNNNKFIKSQQFCPEFASFWCLLSNDNQTIHLFEKGFCCEYATNYWTINIKQIIPNEIKHRLLYNNDSNHNSNKPIIVESGLPPLPPSPKLPPTPKYNDMYHILKRKYDQQNIEMHQIKNLNNHLIEENKRLKIEIALLKQNKNT